MMRSCGAGLGGERVQKDRFLLELNVINCFAVFVTFGHNYTLRRPQKSLTKNPFS